MVLGLARNGGVAAVVLLISCGRSSDGVAGSEVSTTRQAVVWTPAPAARTLRSVGEACPGGERDCATGVCLHVEPEPDRGRYCGAACQSSQHCPTDWDCVDMIPGREETRVCRPPSGWTSRAVTVRTPYARRWTRQLVDDDPQRLRLPDAGLESDGGVR